MQQYDSNILNQNKWQNLAIIVTAIITAFISLSITFYMHDVYSWPQDDGVFSYLAWQINLGRIFGADFYTNHPGYHSALNALLFRIFGTDIVVLRYPIIFLTALQSIITVYLLREKGVLIAFLGGLSATTLSFLQFLNPSPNWFCLFFVFCAILILATCPNSAKRNIMLGVIIGICIMFRHPSGIFLGFGVLTYLLYEAGKIYHNSLQIKQDLYSFQLKSYNSSTVKGIDAGNQQRYLGMSALLIIAMLLSITYYAYLLYTPLVFLLFGIWPILLLLIMLNFKHLSDKHLIPMILWSAIGVIIAISPMIIYQLIYGDISSWFATSIIGGNGIYNKDFFERRYYHTLSGLIAILAEQPNNIFIIIRIIYWLLMFSLPVIVGIMAIRKYYLSEQNIKANDTQQKSLAILFVTLFYGYNSFYFQVGVYFYSSISLFILALLYYTELKNKITKALLVSALIFINFAAIITESEFASYAFLGKYEQSKLSKFSTHLYPHQNIEYLHLTKVITQNSAENDSIFVFPLNPEIYFLSERLSALKNYGSIFYNDSDESYRQFWQELDAAKPKLLIMNYGSKYVEPFDRRLLADLKQSDDYELLERYTPNHPGASHNQKYNDYIIFIRK